MHWLFRLFRRRYRLPKRPARECATVCFYCGKRRILVTRIRSLTLWGIPAGLCEECVDKCSSE